MNTTPGQASTYTFEYTNEELEKAWEDQQQSLCSTVATVRWIFRRQCQGDDDAIRIIESIVNRMARLGGPSKLILKPHSNEPGATF